MRRIRVATFNIQHGLDARGGVEPTLLAESCVGLGADVLALQEVDVGLARSGGVDQAALVAEATGMHVVFGPNLARQGGWYGNALLARSPIAEVEQLALPVPGEREPRGAILARVEGVSVAAMHLSVGADAHGHQLDVAAAALATRPAPRVLLGDLNHDVRALDGYDVVRGPATWPAHRPRKRIDHVAVVGLTVEDVEVRHLPVSDHRALVVTLGL